MTQPTRPVLRYYGGKWSLAPWLLTFFPEHGTYVETFGGAASVLMRKAPAVVDVYNDLDGEIVNLFRVLREPPAAEQLYRALELTPYGLTEFLSAYEGMPDEPATEPVERARRTLVRGFQGHGSSGANGVKRTGFRRPCRQEHNPASDWIQWREQLPAFTRRLAAVVIEQLDFARLVEHYDTPNTLFYVDPPYQIDTRGRAYEGSPRHRGIDVVYRHDMRDDDDHRRVALVFREVQGMVVVSGYPCALYDEELFPDWERHEREHRADARLPRTEVVWLNPACSAALRAQRQQGGLFDVA